MKCYQQNLKGDATHSCPYVNKNRGNNTSVNRGVFNMNLLNLNRDVKVYCMGNKFEMFLTSLREYKNLSECEILWIRTFTFL